MDPISALGAASSAIGIASFALELSVGLFKLASQVRSAKDSLKGVGESVKSVAYALEEVEQLLRKEEQHVQQGKSLRMFSAQGLGRVKETADQCLAVLWKIEAVAMGCDEPEEPKLAARLAARASASEPQAIALDSRLTKPMPGFWDRFVFAVSSKDKLEEFSKQLQNFQISLGLIFNVVTVTYLLTQSSITDEDRQAIEAAKEDLHRSRPNYREAAQGVLHGITTTPNDKVEGTPRQSIEPAVQRLARQDNTVPFAVAKSVLIVEHPGLEKTHKPRINHLFQNRLASNDSGAMTIRSMGLDQLQDDEPGSSRNLSIPDADLEQAEASERPSQMTTALRGGTSDPEPVLPVSKDSSGQMSSSTRADMTSNPMKVYSRQKRGDWRREQLSQAEILQRLAKLDLDPLGVLDKKLSLPMKHQTRIDDIHMEVNIEEASPKDYHWTLRAIELKNKRLGGLSLRGSWGLLAIIIYLEREAQNSPSEGQIFKSILKQPKPNFPEEPEPVREGVSTPLWYGRQRDNRFLSLMSKGAASALPASCSACSKKNLKCNGQIPCSGCLDEGHGSNCVYFVPPGGSQRSRTEMTAPQSILEEPDIENTGPRTKVVLKPNDMVPIKTVCPPSGFNAFKIKRQAHAVIRTDSSLRSDKWNPFRHIWVKNHKRDQTWDAEAQIGQSLDFAMPVDEDFVMVDQDFDDAGTSLGAEFRFPAHVVPFGPLLPIDAPTGTRLAMGTEARPSQGDAVLSSITGGGTDPDCFDDSTFTLGRAADFPTVSAEQLSDAESLPSVLASYHPPRASDGDVTPNAALGRTIPDLDKEEQCEEIRKSGATDKVPGSSRNTTTGSELDEDLIRELALFLTPARVDLGEAIPKSSMSISCGKG